MAGLRITLAPGWKTYWRAPGEAGIPPSFDWSTSENLALASTHFPTPDVFEINGMRTIGYGGSVVLPLAFRPADAGGAIALRGSVSLGVCETICIPFSARIAADLVPGTDRGEREIRAALAQAPRSAAEAGVDGVGCRVEPIADGLRLTALIDMPSLGRDEIAVFEAGDPDLWISGAEVRRTGGTLVAAADLVAPHGGPFVLDRSAVRVTVLADGHGVEIEGCRAG
jgi:DsbC/DsbD-like thiol-disulfide interchange protein